MMVGDVGVKSWSSPLDMAKRVVQVGLGSAFGRINRVIGHF